MSHSKKLASSLYIHIPFCSSRCIYCDFYSTTLGEEVRKRYVTALLTELKQRSVEATSLSTIYIGGGTPSVLSPHLLFQLFKGIRDYFNVQDEVEITLECNPDDVNSEFVRLLKELQVNRVSLGVQTFDDNQLSFLRRRHTALQAKEAVEMIAAEVTQNVSVDLIFGLPNQTLEDWQSNLRMALCLPITHLSAYALSYEEGTPLWKMQKGGAVCEVPEELSVNMYERLTIQAEKAGFEHYEISNFAQPDFRSRHNSVYWKGKPYIGCGASAHSFDGQNTRRANVSDIQTYTEKMLQGKNPFSLEEISVTEKYNELVMTRLRTSDGLNVESLSSVQKRYFVSAAKNYVINGLLTVENNIYRLTRKGIFVSDGIISDLMQI